MTPFGPGGAPREGIRPWVAGVAALLVVALIPLMFADRAPDLLRAMSKDIEHALPDFFRFTLKPKLPNPEPDLAVHLAVFSSAAVLVGLVCWSWRTFLVGQLLVLGGGVAIEILQPVVSSSREVQMSDIAANVSGQVIGIFLALAAIGAWAWWERHRAAHQPSGRH
jgi:hypothetical protein